MAAGTPAPAFETTPGAADAPVFEPSSPDASAAQQASSLHPAVVYVAIFLAAAAIGFLLVWAVA